MPILTNFTLRVKYKYVTMYYYKYCRKDNSLIIKFIYEKLYITKKGNLL